jgi:MMPL family
VSSRRHVVPQCGAGVRRADILCPVRGRRVAHRSGIGLQHLHRGPGLARGPPAAHAGCRDRRDPGSARAVSTAAVILATSFGLLALVPLRPFREIAFTMSVGVLLDALFVRSLLTPALFALLGDASGWPSRRLRRTGTPVVPQRPVTGTARRATTSPATRSMPADPGSAWLIRRRTGRRPPATPRHRTTFRAQRSPPRRGRPPASRPHAVGGP